MASRALMMQGRGAVASARLTSRSAVASSESTLGNLSLVASARDPVGLGAAPSVRSPAVREQHRKAPQRPAFAGPPADVIVELARTFIKAHIARDLGAARLAGATGVSESTLRRAVHAQTGLRLQQFVMRIRLDQAHAWLSTNRESRTQAQIASALGWRSAPAFGRAYAQRFGETMTETRRRAVRAGEDKSTRANNSRSKGV